MSLPFYFHHCVKFDAFGLNPQRLVYKETPSAPDTTAEKQRKAAAEGAAAHKAAEAAKAKGEKDRAEQSTPEDAAKTAEENAKAHEELTAAEAREKKRNPEQEKLYRQGERLRRLHERVRDGAERKTKWNERNTYKDAVTVFDRATSGPLSGHTFDSLWKTDGQFDHQKSRENKELFFAILAEKTNDFQKNPADILSPNYQENIKHFPFLYHAWLDIKYPGFEGRRKEAQKNVESAQAKLEGVDFHASLQDLLGNVGAIAGLKYDEINKIPKKPEIDYWGQVTSKLDHYAKVLNKKSGEPEVASQKELLKGAAEKINNVLHPLAKAQWQLARLRGGEEKVSHQFTSTELGRSENQNHMIEMLMRQFQKSVEMVDKPLGNGNWQEFYHPTVRRLLIASIFERGVGGFKKDQYGNDEYVDDVRERNNWMLERIVNSRKGPNGRNFFGPNESGRNMDSAHRVALEMAYMGGQVARELAESERGLEYVKALIKVKENPNDPGNEAILDELSHHFSEQEVARMNKDLQTLTQKKEEIEKDNEKRRKLLKSIQPYLDDPYSEYSQKWFAWLDENGDGSLMDGQTIDTYFTPDQLSRFDQKMRNTEINYNILDRDEKDNSQYLDHMGMNVTNIYDLYLKAMAKNPQMHFRNWADHINEKDPTKVGQLASFLNNIIPETNPNAKGESVKKDFLAVLTHLYDPIPEWEDNENVSKQRAVARDMVAMLRIHLEHEESIRAAREQKMPELEKRLKGMSVGDQVSAYVKKVWKMTFAPGQSIANRIAGGIALFTALKLIRKGMSGDGNTGKLVMAAGLAFSAELVAKNVTGEGLLERAGINTLDAAAEGTHEEYLAQQGEARMEKLKNPISKEEHLRALFVLDKVPFYKVMEWYEKTDPSGADYDPNRSDRPELDSFNEMGVDTSTVVKGVQNRHNKDARARYILRETVESFFETVATKEGKTVENARKGIRERWVDTVRNPNLQASYSDTNFGGNAGDLESILWKHVMMGEVSAYMVDQTEGQNTPDKVLRTVVEWGSDLSEWTREHVVNPGEGYAETFFMELGGYADEVGEGLTTLAKEAGLKYHFAKEGIKFWYNNNEWEIRRFGENAWKLFATGATLPFKAAYVGLDFAIPWTLTKLNQVTEILRPDKLVTTKNGDLSEADIMRASAVVGGQVVTDREFNPEYTYFGDFQEPFLGALQNVDGPRYYKDLTSGVGYYISETNHGLTDIDVNNPDYDNPGNRYNKMEAAAKEDAIRHFVKQGMKESEIKKHMYAIHTVIRTNPEKVYVFWRMPLEDSAEYKLKEAGRWVDNPDPNRWKEGGPVMFEPTDTGWDNFQDIIGVKSDTARVLVGGVGKYGVQLPRLWFGAAENIGFVVRKIVEKIDKTKKPDEYKWITEMTTLSPITQQFLDESTTSASESYLAMSDFYKSKSHADMYKLALAYARTSKKPLFLGFFKGEAGYEGRMYMEPPEPEAQYYAKLKAYYETTWLKTNKKSPVEGFDRYLQQGLRNAATP